MSANRRRLLSTEKIAVNPKRAQVSLVPTNKPEVQSLQKVTKIVQSKFQLFNFAGFRQTLDKVTNKAGIKSGFTRSAQNVHAHKEAKSFFNVAKNIGTKVVEKLDIFNSSQKQSFANIFSGNVPAMVEQGGKTNVNRISTKGSLLPNIINPQKNTPLKEEGRFKGYNTPADYEFTFVSSVDELVSELNKSRRGPTNTGDDSIRGLILSHTYELYGPEEKVNAKLLHELSKKEDSQDLGLTEASGPNAINYGIQPHYVITRAGNIQRGRPSGLVTDPELGKFSKSSLKLTFIAGKQAPINKKQEIAFDQFLQAWFTVFKEGGPVYARYEYDLEDGDSYDVLAKIRVGIPSKYNIVYRYGDISDFDEFPSKIQTSITKPTKIAEPSSIGTKPKDVAQQNDAISEEAFQKKLNNDLESAFNYMGATTDSLNGVSRDEIIAKRGAQFLPDGDPKAKLDADFAKAENHLDNLSKSINKYYKNANANFKTIEQYSKDIDNG